jgi:hypothetical protein
MSVNSHLTSLSSSLVLSSQEKESIKTSIGTLYRRLNEHFGSTITKQLQFGSSTRDTILPRKVDANSDIDYMVVFDTSSGQYQPQTYLDRLKRFTEAKYSTSERSQSHPTIVLSLNHIKFELVPAIQSSIYSQSYSIPSPASDWMQWITANPSQINQQLQTKNTACNSQIKPLVRLVKYWNAKNGYPFRSFELETYIINQSFWNCISLKDYFYQFWNGFSCQYGTAQYIKDKVDRAKRIIAETKNHETKELPATAELHIQALLPPL